MIAGCATAYTTRLPLAARPAAVYKHVGNASLRTVCARHGYITQPLPAFQCPVPSIRLARGNNSNSKPSVLACQSLASDAAAGQKQAYEVGQLVHGQVTKVDRSSVYVAANGEEFPVPHYRVSYARVDDCTQHFTPGEQVKMIVTRVGKYVDVAMSALEPMGQKGLILTDKKAAFDQAEQTAAAYRQVREERRAKAQQLRPLLKEGSVVEGMVVRTPGGRLSVEVEGVRIPLPPKAFPESKRPRKDKPIKVLVASWPEDYMLPIVTARFTDGPNGPQALE